MKIYCVTFCNTSTLYNQETIAQESHSYSVASAIESRRNSRKIPPVGFTELDVEFTNWCQLMPNGNIIPLTDRDSRGYEESFFFDEDGVYLGPDEIEVFPMYKATNSVKANDREPDVDLSLILMQGDRPRNQLPYLGDARMGPDFHAMARSLQTQALRTPDPGYRAQRLKAVADVVSIGYLDVEVQEYRKEVGIQG